MGLDCFHIERLEFVVTKNCNSRCKHCSVISPEVDTDTSFKDTGKLHLAIERIMKEFTISSAMTYGGEPLLYPEVTINLHRMFKNNNIHNRELITNGFIKKNNNNVSEIAISLIDAGVSKILVSVDAFHQEHIPIEYVELFIDNILSTGFRNILLHPAWLLSKNSDNEYNFETRSIINGLKMKFNISISDGNIIAPAGFSRKLLGGYFKKVNLDISKICGEIPYTNSLTEIKNLRFLPNGNINICRGICIGNLFEDSIEDIFNNYSPYTNPITSLLLNGGVDKLIEKIEHTCYAINPDEYFGICDLCTDCIKAIKQLNASEGDS